MTTDREKRDIQKILKHKDYFRVLSEHHKTENVSLVAVIQCGKNLEYVPETVINKEICRRALCSKQVDCTILPYIPYPDVLKEAIQKFSADTPAFVLYSLSDIRDKEMAQNAVKADAYCIQLVPDELLTKDLCRTALQSPNADEKMSKFVFERFPELKTEQKSEDEKVRKNTGVKMR